MPYSSIITDVPKLRQNQKKNHNQLPCHIVALT